MTGFFSINPYNAKSNGFFPFISSEIVQNRIDKSKDDFYNKWRNIPVKSRAANILPVAGYIRQNKDFLAHLITCEMGKPVKESIAELEKVAWLIEYHCENASRWLRPKKIRTNYSSVYISYQPLGGIFGIMPWNFPFWQVFRFAIPTLLAGNAVFIKHAPNVPLCALEIEKIFHRFLPAPGIYQNLFIDVTQVEAVIANNFIQGVSLTGSETAGSIVGSLAGKHLKKAVLELGGTDPFIILDDADQEEAVNQFILSRMSNNGQICIAAKRLFVQSGVYDKVKELLIAGFSKLRTGDPMDTNTRISCLARADLKLGLINQLKKLEDDGAVFLIKNEEVPANKCIPLLLELNKSHCMDFDEEIFGPVAIIIRFDSIDEVSDLVNSSRYGLAASLWSKDEKVIDKLINHLETGNIAVNKMVASDPRIPFGGIKKSGYGKEMAESGIKEFVNAKSVVIN